MTPNQLNTLKVFLEGLVEGKIAAENIPLMAQFALAGVEVALEQATDRSNVVNLRGA